MSHRSRRSPLHWLIAKLAPRRGALPCRPALAVERLEPRYLMDGAGGDLTCPAADSDPVAEVSALVAQGQHEATKTPAEELPFDGLVSDPHPMDSSDDAGATEADPTPTERTGRLDSRPPEERREADDAAGAEVGSEGADDPPSDPFALGGQPIAGDEITGRVDEQADAHQTNRAPADEVRGSHRQVQGANAADGIGARPPGALLDNESSTIPERRGATDLDARSNGRAASVGDAAPAIDAVAQPRRSQSWDAADLGGDSIGTVEFAADGFAAEVPVDNFFGAAPLDYVIESEAGRTAFAEVAAYVGASPAVAAVLSFFIDPHEAQPSPAPSPLGADRSAVARRDAFSHIAANLRTSRAWRGGAPLATAESQALKTTPDAATHRRRAASALPVDAPKSIHRDRAMAALSEVDLRRSPGLAEIYTSELAR